MGASRVAAATLADVNFSEGATPAAGRMRLALELTITSFVLNGASNSVVQQAAMAARWIMLVALATVVLPVMVKQALDRRNALRQPFLALLLFGSFGIVTTLWSQVPMFTLLKSASYLLLTTTMFLGGANVARCVPDDPYAFLRLPLLVLLASSIAAPFVPGYGVIQGNFAGLTVGSNLLAAIVTLCLPWPLFLASRGDARPRWLGQLLLVVACPILVFARSRAALLACGAFAMAKISTLPMRRITIVLACVLAALGIGAAAAPELANEMWVIFVMKGDPGSLKTHRWAYGSHAGQWKRTVLAIRSHGLTGVGFGVSDGMSSTWKGGVSSGSAAREKGASPLAVVEETGVLGFALYVALLTALARCAMRKPGRRSEDAAWDRFAIAYLGGAILNTVTEDWFIGPGAPESAIFWATLGALLASRLAHERSDALSPV